MFLDINILLSLYLSEFYPFSLRDFGIEATCRRLLSPHSPRLVYSETTVPYCKLTIVTFL